MEYKIGKHRYCPKCGSERAKIVWISKDGNTIAVQCPTSGYQHKERAVMLIDTSPRRESDDLEP
ncbi:MAG: hypothetical protein OEZ21_01360 [Candidatus Bathyarchaeota archaeon]|nr:hypothetical protein [Candidatus Bathyarchaeota archaeon]MDH5745591.1 hypothetical protein [Candidatus Bathyarchaeota archaeon]